MTSRLPAALVASVLLATAPGDAQPSFGEAFPLTATRSGTMRGQQPLLTSDGRNPVLFWTDGLSVRMSRLQDGGFSPSREILDMNYGEGAFDAVWTGRHFVVVSAGAGGILSRRLSASGEPLDEPVVVTEGRRPRIAFNGSRILLLFLGSSTLELSAILLDSNGIPVENAARPLGIESPAVIALAGNGSSFAAVIPRPLEPLIMRFDSAGAVLSTAIAGPYGGSSAIATDGSRYLAVLACASAGPCGSSYARVVHADGHIDAALELDPPFPLQPSAAWSGSEWLVSYTRDFAHPALHLLTLDSGASVVTRRDVLSAAGGSVTAIGGKGYVARVLERYFDTIYVNELPITESGIPATFAPKRQLLPVAATGNDGTLVVWQEMGDGRTTLHAGVRAKTGEWTERELWSWAPRDCFYCYEEPINVLAASNGSSFLMLSSDGGGPRLDRIDQSGVPTGEAIRLPYSFFVRDILWNGHDYLLIGSESVLRLDDEDVFHVTPLPKPPGQDAVFASDGNGHVLAAWIDYHISEFGSAPVRLAVMRFDDQFNPIDATPVTLAVQQDVPWAHSVAWDGERFVVAWSGANGIMASRVSAAGDPAVHTVRLAPGEAEQTAVARVSGGALVHWSSFAAGNLAAMVTHEGTTTLPVTLSTQRSHGTLVPLPGGGAGYLDVRTLHAPPYEGTDRITLRVSQPPLPSLPPPPLLDAVRVGSVVNLTWTSSGSDTDGYRLEMRNGEGPWVELEETIGPLERSLTIPLSRANVFRVRAWNEAGLGGYSETRVISTRTRLRR